MGFDTQVESNCASVRHRAFKFALDPTAAQETKFHRLAGAARMAYNAYVAEARARKARWDAHRASLVSQGLEGEGLSQAMREAVDASEKTDQPMKGISGFAFTTQWLTPVRADHEARAEAIAAGTDAEAVMADSGYDLPWLHEVPRRVQVSGTRNAGQAWANWMDSKTGRRAGKPMRFPRFKRRGSGDSFTVPAPEKMGARGTTWGRGKNTQTIEDYRHVYAAFLGSIRTHDSTRRLVRSLERGGRIRSYTLTRGASRWYLSFLVEEPFSPPPATRAQRKNGTVGVDLGVKTAAALSTGALISNPRRGDQERRRITKLQRKIARTQKGSNRRARLVRALGASNHRIAQRRETDAHKLTKTLATHHDRIGIEDLNVVGMTASASGTLENPGTNVAAKSGMNRSILDAGFARIRDQLQYKTNWYGSELIVIDRYFPSSKTCSDCGAVKPKLRLSQRVFTCECGYEADRDINAARNIAAAADKLACDTRESLNGRGGPDSQWWIPPAADRPNEASRPPGLTSPRGSLGASNGAPFPE